ncbi:MAG: thrombospondin type 3 repeat-containing protein, partial [Verrucomicrobiota bacterium]
NNNWSQSAVTWATAPNLSQNVAAGNTIPSQFVNGLGDSAFLQGQLVFSSTTFSEQQIDVSSFIRARTNYDASFLVSQDPRWNVTLPSLAPGDTQPDGMQLVSLEGSAANGPRLLLVRLKDTDNDGISDEAETNIFGTNPNNPDTDGDGDSDGQEILVAGTNPLVAPPLPILKIQLSGNNAVVSWPTNSPGFILEETTVLPTTNWTAVTNSLGVSGTNNTASFNINGSNRFLRLRK